MHNRLTLYNQLLNGSRDNYKALVGVVQLTAGLDMDKNYEKNKELIEVCASRGAKLVCLPENFNYMGRSYTDGIEVAQPLNGTILKRYK